MPEETTAREEEKRDEEFGKKCELVKKQIQRLKRKAKKPISRKILEMKFVI